MSKLSRWVDENVTHKTARREAVEEIAAQRAYYKSQQDLAESELAKATAEEEEQKRRINEKTVRRLRRGHSAPGLMDAPSNEVKENLG
jgi:hypothetical protein